MLQPSLPQLANHWPVFTGATITVSVFRFSEIAGSRQSRLMNFDNLRRMQGDALSAR